MINRKLIFISRSENTSRRGKDYLYVMHYHMPPKCHYDSQFESFLDIKGEEISQKFARHLIPKGTRLPKAGEVIEFEMDCDFSRTWPLSRVIIIERFVEGQIWRPKRWKAHPPRVIIRKSYDGTITYENPGRSLLGKCSERTFSRWADKYQAIATKYKK